ncbi:hypothetical protein [Knoellia aerolata]|uniref:Uncharacterized protein n=1 Tax=Knoellia aerolata DSM 18566 TaxID=1385519 RepID=A0A0A0K292_9MICO|nr:hypothetical protein [Knoellia aerolata]KGN42427.1 hypothetical protein N801_17345 [Knoellia aerolata DSM 18566]
MDVSTFYALFSATCFTLVGLWWTVVQKHEAWLRTAEGRRDMGGIYLAFLLPALMGLFAQIGGTTNPLIWRVSFVAVAAIGCWSTLRLLHRSRRDGDAGTFARHRWIAAVIYAAVAVLGVAPEIAEPLGVTPLQAEATLLILLVAVAHWLVWEFMTHTEPDTPT